MRYILILLAWVSVCAWADEGDHLTVLSCVGEQTHELVLSWADDEALLTYYADDTAVATSKASTGYVDDLTLYVPFLGTWYVFDERGGQVVAGDNADSCKLLLAPSERIDPKELGFMDLPKGEL